MAGYAVHIYTASGIIFAFLAAAEVARDLPDPRRVFLWLIVAVLIDATDGPLARLAEVKRSAPRINGRTIDDIVDFLTFTFIPLMLIAKMEWVPAPALLFVAPALIASLLGFANVGAKDESGGFFIGFPSYWNIVALYAGIAAAHELLMVNGIALLILAVATVLPIGFIYPNLAPPRWKLPIMAGAYLWLVMALGILYYFPYPPLWLVGASLVYPLFYVVISLIEFARVRSSRT
jgi:phosphatidylcholine synthase